MSEKNLEVGGAFTAKADYTAAQYEVVNLDGTANDVELTATAILFPFGVLQNAPDIGEPCTLIHEGVTRIKLGGTVARGELLKIDTGDPGAVVEWVPGTDGHTHGGADAPPTAAGMVWCVGQALEAGVDGQTILAWFSPRIY